MSSPDTKTARSSTDEKASTPCVVTTLEVEARSTVHDDGVVHLERRFSFMACLGMAFMMLNSWTGMSSALNLVLSSGGSVSVVYGCMVSALGACATGLSLAELCHVYPVTGGQYDWIYILAPARFKVGLAYVVGWLASAGWCTLLGICAAYCASMIPGFVGLWNPDVEMTKWQIFLLYVLFAALGFSLNTFAVRLLPMVEKTAFYWGVVGIIAVSVTVLATAAPNFQPPKAVFATFTNETGWPSGVAFLLGMMQSTLGLAGYDAVTHMMEEMPAPSKNAPKVIMLAISMGAVTAWLFLVILLLCVQNLEEVMTSPMGPLVTIYLQATNSRVAATCLLLFNFVAVVFMTQGVVTVASRMCWTFSRDRGLGHVSPFLAPVHPTLLVPVGSLIFVLCVSVVIGCIYLGSDVAFNAIAASGLTLVQLSYLIPILMAFIRGEAAFEGQPRTWSLGRYRRLVNGTSIAFLIVTCTFFSLPPSLPVTGPGMNYAVVVLATVAILSTIVWFVDGRKRYYGPTELETRLAEGRRTW
ncbi:hypothetical protein Q8F55_000174 [Vanrija albida]|uniref:Amino acid permease/ SLC12A domain-containing protein n=1 Tax=Vanrija albida TaxID=181172 RepID=A0ABR3QCI6_9TREE